MGSACMLNRVCDHADRLVKVQVTQVTILSLKSGNHTMWDVIRIRLCCELDMCILVQYGFLLRM